MTNPIVDNIISEFFGIDINLINYDLLDQMRQAIINDNFIALHNLGYNLISIQIKGKDY
jgi:hypothetical protein